MNLDRNFDDIADHFEHKIYNGIKGRLRSAVILRDLNQNVLPSLSPECDSILDLGAGLGQFSIKLALDGFKVTYNDISQKMTSKAQRNARERGMEASIVWINTSYTYFLNKKYQDAFSLVLCHALIEWLANPTELLRGLNQCVRENGFISLCVYNPAATLFHNLLRGNFDWVDRHREGNSFMVAKNDASLTPPNPIALNEVEENLQDNGFEIISCSGIRVFSDYVRQKTGGNLLEEEILKQELIFSELDPYKKMGRYVHYLVCKKGV